MTRYRNIGQLPRERRGEPAQGETCRHGRALQGEGCPACGAEAGENVDSAKVVAMVLGDPVAGVVAERGALDRRRDWIAGATRDIGRGTWTGGA
jgi:hypothetical protein